MVKIMLDSDNGHLLIRDSSDREMGFDGGIFTGEIPGAYASAIIGGKIPAEPVYLLPFTGTYTIKVDGGTLTQTERVGVAQFGPDYAASIEGIELAPGNLNEVLSRNDGARFAFRSASSQQISLTLALDGQETSYKFDFNHVDLGVSQTVTMTADIGNECVEFDNSKGMDGDYDFVIRLLGSTDEWLFSYRNLEIDAGSTHLFDFSAWKENNSVTLDIDEDSDGDVDKSQILENQISRIYLPLVLK